MLTQKQASVPTLTAEQAVSIIAVRIEPRLANFVRYVKDYKLKKERQEILHDMVHKNLLSPRNALMDIFMAITQYYMTHRKLEMHDETRQLLASIRHMADSCDESVQKETIRNALRLIEHPRDALEQYVEMRKDIAVRDALENAKRVIPAQITLPLHILPQAEGKESC